MPDSALNTAEQFTPQPVKTNLLGLSVSKLGDFFEQLGEKRFRATQMVKWIHQMGEQDFDQMTNLSKSLREKLHETAEVRLPEVVSCQDSTDGTRKWLIKVEGGSCIEMVYIPEKDRGTLCVSSQIGCALDCSFCATGKQGFNRDLDTAEIIGQLWIAAQSFDQFAAKAPRRVSNVVMMGMGEPLMNFNNVVDAMNLMMEDNAYGLSKRRVTLSTAGVVPALDQLAGVTDVSLAISLHAPNDELRNELVPINRKYNLAQFVESAKNYIEKMPDNRRKATVEYTLMDQVNDRSVHARELAVLLKDLPCKINLIPFNPFPGSDYKRVTNTALNRFRDILQGEGYTVTVRTTRGDDIAAACGQLAGEVNDRTKRQQRYKNKLAAEEVPIKLLD
ncbi:23S rRNA (adenine(2503)-C(2))-methyltransferase RlmN [Porticoccaceae bacterium]|jgi:23S rRNA (adenine2503-C2)-methyltransferase|nr:23S rRNA (adenine(2503)-C(2))-methyltransferase RlmN [Porticoccaceae bacterium]MDA9014703.1 23S rRNA (adenine(2503)-C(2))-methyltransferase RlmN [Porticoccaceae bacterium]